LARREKPSRIVQNRDTRKHPIITTENAMRVAASIVVENERGQILLVREADPRVSGLYNLPGGHVEAGESPDCTAIREAHEEVGLNVVLDYLVGVYCAEKGYLFVFHARSPAGYAVPQSLEIQSVEWKLPADIFSLPISGILHANRLWAIIRDFMGGRQYSLECIRHVT